MHLRRTLVATCMLAAVACGNSSGGAASGSDAQPSTTASVSTSTPEVTVSSDPSADGATTTAALGTSLVPASPVTGLVHGTVERACSSNPGSGSGCFNQAGGIAGATVEVRQPEGSPVARTTTDAAGMFEVRVSPGRYVIYETSSGVSQERDIPAGQTTFVGLVLPSN
jgi:hypothetical protein